MLAGIGGQHRMTRPLSVDLRERVIAAVLAGESCRLVAARFGVAVSSVVKWSQRHRATGSVAPGNFDPRQAYQRTIEALQRADRPTALMAISNMMTLGLLLAVRELKLRIPADLSIVGIDDLEFAAVINPPPTVVVTPILAMARRSIEVLLGQINHKKAATGAWETPQPHLLIRKSTRAMS